MNKLINPILFIMCLLAMACSDDNNENETFAPFSLEKRYYEVRLERNATSIPPKIRKQSQWQSQLQ